MNGNQEDRAPEGHVAPSTPPGAATPVYDPPSLVEPSIAQQPAPQSVPAPVTPIGQPAEAAAANPAPTPMAEQVATPAPQPSVQAEPVPSADGAGFYKADSQPPTLVDEALPERSAPSAAAANGPLSWKSSGEDIQSHSAHWRMRMSLIGVICAALVYLLTRDLISTGAVALGGILFGILGARKPAALQYRIDSRGIVIGNKHFAYSDFRAFSVLDGARGISLVPLKRFMPMMVIHCDQTLLPQVVQYLGDRLPMEAPRHDLVDRVVGGLKF